MSDDVVRKIIYRNCRKRVGATKREWATLFGLGKFQGPQNVHKKEQPETSSISRGVNMPEALAAQLLAFLHDEGYDVTSIEFDEMGQLVAVPKQGEL